MKRYIAGALTLALASLLSAAPGDKMPTSKSTATAEQKTEKSEATTSQAKHHKKEKKTKNSKPSASSQPK